MVFERRTEALLVWMNVFSQKVGLPVLTSLNDVWKDHMGSLGFLCHAQETQKKPFSNQVEAFKDAKFVLQDLQEVKNDEQKIMYFKEVDFEAAAGGDPYEIYKCVLLMIVEMFIYLRKSKTSIDDYIDALSANEKEKEFTDMIMQVTDNTGGSWWECIGTQQPTFKRPHCSVPKEETNPTTPKRPRQSNVSLYATPLQSSGHRSSIAVSNASSPLNEHFHSPRMSLLAESKNVVRLKLRIDELNDDVADKEESLKTEREKRVELAVEMNKQKQIASERQQEVRRLEERNMELEAELNKLKMEHKNNLVKTKEAIERKEKYKLQLEEDEFKMEELSRERNEFEETSKVFESELKDAMERQDAFDRVEKSLETKVSSLHNQLENAIIELENAQAQIRHDRKTSKEQMEEKEQDYENTLFEVRTKLAQMDRTIEEKTEENKSLCEEFRLRLQNEQKDCEQKIAGIKVTLEQELERHQLLLKQQIDDSTEEKERYATEIQMLNEMLSNTLRGKTDEHDQMVTSLRRQHELELMSLRSKMDLNEQMVERQKEDVERYKKESMAIQEQLLKSQEAELAACNKQNELVTEKDTEITRLRQNLDQQRQMQTALETERASLMAKKAETDRYLREEVEQLYQLLKGAQTGIINITAEKDEKVKEIADLRGELEKMKADHEAEMANLRKEIADRAQFVPPAPPVKKEVVQELPTSSSATNLNSTVIKSQSFNDSKEFEDRIHDDGDEEPMQMMQSCIGTRKTESFFVDFSKDDNVENEDPVGRHTDVCSRLSIASVSRMSMTSGNSMFSEGRTSSAQSAIPEIPSNYSMYAPKDTDRDRIEVLKRRNNANPPALRSSYATEFTNYTSPNGSEHSLKGMKKSKSTLSKVSSNITRSFARMKK